VVAIDLYEERMVSHARLAEYRWHSESGGAPVSWDGGGVMPSGDGLTTAGPTFEYVPALGLQE